MFACACLAKGIALAGNLEVAAEMMNGAHGVLQVIVINQGEPEMRLGRLGRPIQRVLVGGDGAAEIARGQAIGTELELLLRVAAQIQAIASAREEKQRKQQRDDGSFRGLKEKLNESTHENVLRLMTTARLVRASAARAAFVNRSWRTAGVIGLVIFSGVIATRSTRATTAEPPGAGGNFQLQLAIRAEPVAFLSLQGRPRGFQLREFVESSLPPAGSVRLGEDEPLDGWDWAGFRRQLVRALAGARKVRFERDAVSVESDRFNEPGRIPGVVQDAAIASGVRARLAAEPGLRGQPVDVQCREGCVRIRGQFAHCPETRAPGSRGARGRGRA